MGFLPNIFIAHSFNPSSQIANNDKKWPSLAGFKGPIYGGLYIVLTTFYLLLITDL